MSVGYYQGSPSRESGVVSDCDTMAELASLLRSEIPEGRSNLSDNHTNLQRVAEYCEANYFQTDNKRGALEETKNYTTQSLASVAYQINTLAYNFLQLLEMQSAQLAEMESQMNHISQTVMIHKEKVARREIGVLTANKSTNRQYKIIAPANPEKPVKYLRKPIDYTIFDDIGHGLRSGGTPRQKQRGSSSGSIHSVNSMAANTIVGPAPTTKPPTPPQVSRASSKVSLSTGGTLSKNNREYRTPPAVAPPQVPTHYAPNYPMGHPRRERGPGYSQLPIVNPSGQPQVGMVHPMQNQQQNIIQPQTPPPPPPPSQRAEYGVQQHHDLHNMPPPPSPLINSQEMVLSSNQHHPMMMGGHHGPVPLGSLGMHTLSHAQGHRMSQALQQQLAASRSGGSQSPPLPPPPPPEDEHESFGRPRTSSSGVMPIVPDDDDLPGWVPKNYIEKVVAIYDYYADKDDELSFQESAVIYVLKKNDDGWWEGVMDGITGLFPASETLFDLNSWIKHYDVASYDQRNFLQFHHGHRIRRSNHNNNNTRIIKLEVNGQNRIFKLLLKPDDSIFANDVIIESTRNPQLNFNTEITYSGTLADDESAEVHGIITQNGLFEGTIHTGNEDYHIEPISRYLNNSIIKKEPLFHSIIYKTSDINERLLNDKQNKYSSCASEKLRKKRWLLQADAKSPYYGDLILFNGTSRKSYGSWDDSSINSQPIDEILELDNNRTSVDASALIFKNVYKRATIDPKKTTCMLYLQADHQFFQKYGTEEACIEVMTRHVQRVNSIYKNTDFNQDGKKDNITFMVKRIKVHTLEAVKDPQYRFPNNYGVEKFLELFSEEDYDAFCLAYMFTYRDFEMGTLGLAWTGDLKNAGGVCEKNGHYRGSMKSLNTGIVTLLNYGKHVPPAVSHVTLAHEIGHNFGSPHDPEQCTPGGEDGNYIMFARATSGDKKNNNKFSPCSLKSINPVLNYKARSAKGCFTEPKGAICGNGVVEDGEECDCGWEEDCRDQCCFPMRRYAPIDEIPCSLTPKSVCSPSQGPCCTVDCQMKFGDKCREDNGCRDESFCNGKLAQCPLSVNKPNKTICNKEFVCFMGECTGSICLAYGLESCQCIPEIGDIKTKACELCCRLPGDNQPCKSSFEWNDMPFDVPDMFSKPGTPCNDYSGYCDVFQMCREVDPSGPLATLRKLLLSDESIASFKKWIMDYWYAVAAILTTIISLLILSTRYFGKRPSLNKLKSITIMHKQTAETVRLPPDNLQDGVIIHQGIRSKVPLKKRVRNGKIKSRSRKNITGKIINNNNNNTKKKTLNEFNSTTGTEGSGTNNNNLKNSPKKSSPRKKKRLSAAVEDGNNKKNSSVEIPHSKVKKMSLKPKKLKMKKKKMEIIDYSSIKPDIDGKNDTATTIIKPIAVHSAIIQEELLSTSDSVGKVHHWLKTQYNLPKSKSSPSGLSKPALKSRSSRPNNIKNKSRSVANIPSSNNNNNNNEIKDKVRLQVVYKPPFKFSLKLRKPEKLPENNNVKKTNNNKAIRTAILVQHHHHQLPKSSKITDLPSLSSIPINDVAGTSLSKPAAYDTINLSTDNANDNNNINLNVHTVQSDLDVLLSDDEEEEEEEENDYISVDDDNDE